VSTGWPPPSTTNSTRNRASSRLTGPGGCRDVITTIESSKLRWSIGQTRAWLLRRVADSSTLAGMTEVWPGSAFPLGATPSADGTGVAVASEVADRVTLCLFDDQGRQEGLPLPEYDAGVWHGFGPGVGPGQRYGYRVDGPYDPGRGLRCNPAKLLLDPYAKAIAGGVPWDPSFAGEDRQDSAPAAPRSIVVDTAFDWGEDRPPGVHRADSV